MFGSSCCSKRNFVWLSSYPCFFVFVVYVVSVGIEVFPQVLLVVVESVVDGGGVVLGHLSSGGVVAGSVEALVFPRPNRSLGHNQKLRYLAVAKLVVVRIDLVPANRKSDTQNYSTYSVF